MDRGNNRAKQQVLSEEEREDWLVCSTKIEVESSAPHLTIYEPGINMSSVRGVPNPRK